MKDFAVFQVEVSSLHNSSTRSASLMQMSSQAPNYIQTRIPGPMALNTISNSYTFLWRLLTKFSQVRANGIKKLGKY